MFYTLNDNVYLVRGVARGCLYDFNSSKLYSLNKALSDRIDLVNKGYVRQDAVEHDLSIVLQELIQNGLLALSENPTPHYIEEIKLLDKGCSFAWIEITSKCNLKCRHCYNESDAQCTTVMSLHNYKMVIDKLLCIGIKRVQIIGGEPFFDKKLLKAMLDYTVGKFPFIEIFTNGTLIDEAWYEFLAINDIHIALSVYSYRDDIHDAVTGAKGSLSKTNRTIKALKEHGISYRVCNVLMKGVELGDKTTTLYELNEDKDIVRMSGRASFSLKN